MAVRLDLCVIVAAGVLSAAVPTVIGGEPAAMNPFGPVQSERDDAVPGYIELSNGAIRNGMIYLTRDKRLQIYDDKMERQREIPLQAVKKIECTVKREWLEKEWRFKQTTSDEKHYTGRTYPAREYQHTITLKDNRTISGPLSAIVYVQPLTKTDKIEHFLLSKRNKGEAGQDLKSLVYVKRIKLGKDAFEESIKTKSKGLEKTQSASDE